MFYEDLPILGVHPTLQQPIIAYSLWIPEKIVYYHKRDYYTFFNILWYANYKPRGIVLGFYFNLQTIDHYIGISQIRKSWNSTISNKFCWLGILKHIILLHIVNLNKIIIMLMKYRPRYYNITIYYNTHYNHGLY